MTRNGNGNGNGTTNATLVDARPWMAVFLKKLAASGNVYLSCKAANINRSTAYRARHKWSTFADEWEEALDDALDKLEGIAWARASRNSDRLLMFLLQAHRPKKYRQRTEIGGIDGSAPVTFRVVYDKPTNRNHSPSSDAAPEAV